MEMTQKGDREGGESVGGKTRGNTQKGMQVNITRLKGRGGRGRKRRFGDGLGGGDNYMEK